MDFMTEVWNLKPSRVIIWCMPKFCETLINIKSISCEDNQFLIPERTLNPSPLKPRLSCKWCSMNVYHHHQICCVHQRNIYVHPEKVYIFFFIKFSLFNICSYNIYHRCDNYMYSTYIFVLHEKLLTLSWQCEKCRNYSKNESENLNYLQEEHELFLSPITDFNISNLCQKRPS